MKRHIAIPLLCVVLVAALSIPVFSADIFPDNNYSGSGFVTCSAEGLVVIDYFQELAFGSMFLAKFIDSTYVDYMSEYQVTSNYSFNLNVNVPGSFYVAVPTGAYTNFGPIEQYRDESLDYFIDFKEWPITLYDPDPANNTFVTSQGSVDLNITFIGYSDVPAGSYKLITSMMSNNEYPVVFGVYASGYGSGGSGGGTDPDTPGGSGGSGVTGNSGYDGFNNIVDKFQNGNITYTDALDQLGDRYDFIHTTDIYQNLLYVNEYQMSVNKLNGMVSSSAASKSNSLDTQMQGTIDQFAHGSIDLKGAMDSLSGDFSTALSGAQTVEEAQAVTAVYQANLRQLETRNQMKMMQAFDDAMSDEEFQQIQDYYAAEGELINAFDVADFDAQLQFDNWFLLLSQKEAFDYKRFFDYLLNDSEIRHFIIIPLTMGLVSIIMGTRMRVRPSSGGKGDDD